jgi:hypothetical protein
VKDSVGFQAIRNGLTTEIPNGSAYKAWQNLLKIYQPATITHKYDLEQKFNDCRLDKETKNPDIWYTELETIRTILKDDFNTEINDDRMIQHIAYNIKPKAYETAVYNIKRDIQYNPTMVN